MVCFFSKAKDADEIDGCNVRRCVCVCGGVGAAEQATNMASSGMVISKGDSFVKVSKGRGQSDSSKVTEEDKPVDAFMWKHLRLLVGADGLQQNVR